MTQVSLLCSTWLREAGTLVLQVCFSWMLLVWAQSHRQHASSSSSSGSYWVARLVSDFSVLLLFIFRSLVSSPQENNSYVILLVETLAELTLWFSFTTSLPLYSLAFTSLLCQVLYLLRRLHVWIRGVQNVSRNPYSLSTCAVCWVREVKTTQRLIHIHDKKSVSEVWSRDDGRLPTQAKGCNNKKKGGALTERLMRG